MELAIGAVGLTALFQTCFDIYSKIAALKAAEDDLEDARLRLQLEVGRIRFVQSKYQLEGLDIDTERFMAFLQWEINKRMTNIQQLIYKYTTKESTSSRAMRKRPHSTGNKSGFLRQVGRRLKWIAGDRDALNQHLDDLQFWTTTLWNLSSTQAERTSESYWLGTDIVSTQDESLLLTATQIPETLYPGIVKAAKIKQLLLESARVMQSAYLITPTSYISTDFVPMKSIQWQQVSKEAQLPNEPWTPGLCQDLGSGVREVPVIVEWRGPFMQNTMTDVAERRLDQLCNLLRTMHTVEQDTTLSKTDEFERKADFGILECLGWTRTSEVFDSVGLIFRYPHMNTHQPDSLWTKIVDMRRANKIPSLGDRFDLAFGVSNAIANIIGVGWRHRAVRSENMLVFGSTHIKKAYLVGFAYARPEESGQEFSNLPERSELALYRLPQDNRPEQLLDDEDEDRDPFSDDKQTAYHPEPSSAAHDMYGLGIVLLEIGLWNTAAKIMESKRGPRGSGIGKTPSENLKDAIAQLSYRCGDIYRDVVEKCLDPHEWDEKHVMENLSGILGGLKQCRA